MKKKRNSWWGKRYLLLVRDEKSLEERHALSYNKATMTFFIAILTVVILFIAVILVTTIFKQWFDPRYERLRVQRELLELTNIIDSLERESNATDAYLANLISVISGEDKPVTPPRKDVQATSINLEVPLSPIDSQFRVSMEKDNQEDFKLLFRSSSIEGADLYLLSPMNGIITEPYNPQNNHFGVDIVAEEGTSVVAVAEGIVIVSSWTLDSGYVVIIQHQGNLTSVYKHNSKLFKSVGELVYAGELIATIGNTGELTTGPHLHLELWKDSNSVNPLNYIVF